MKGYILTWGASRSPKCHSFTQHSYSAAVVRKANGCSLGLYRVRGASAKKYDGDTLSM